MPNTETPSNPQSPNPAPVAPQPGTLGGAQLGANPQPAVPAAHEEPRATAAEGSSAHPEGGARAPGGETPGPLADTPEPPTGEAGTSPAEGSASPGSPQAAATDASGQPARKRRRRRRKKGPRTEAGAAGESVPAEGEAEGEGEGEGEEGHEEAKADGAPEGAAKPEGEPRRQDKKRPKKDRPREPRERPAFNVGDVVFGKIIEITDEVLFVDLAGKGKAVFDLRELTLPDDPQDEASAVAEEEDDEVSDVAGEMPTGESVPGTPGDTPEAAGEAREAHANGAPDAAGDSAPLDAAGDASGAAADSTGDPPPTLESGHESTATPAEFADSSEVSTRPRLIPTGEPNRRIVKPRHELEAEAKPPEPAPAPAADAAAEGGATEAGATGEAPGGSAPAHETPQPADAAPTHKGPTPPMYAPPVVLELGAHFVGLVHNDGSRGGLVVLTHHPHRASKAKLAANAAFKDKSTIFALVTGVVKGGVEIDFDGLRAFTPGSHMDLRLGTDLHRHIGKRLEFYVTQYGKRGRDVVLSRKPMLEAEAKAHREEALAKLTPGSIVEGTVRSVVSFGAFIDVGGVEGLVPLPEMSHNRSDSPSDVFKAGQTVEVKVTRIDEKGKIWLSRRAAIPDPWAEVAKKYAVGTRHTGKVVRLQPFGAFVELEPAVDGLIHTVDLSIKRIEDPSEVVKVGDALEVVVASLDPGAHKIGLHPAPAGTTADEPHQRVQLHKPVKCAVVAVEAGGLVVRILGATGRHARGFITSAATGTPRGTELRKPFPVGTQLDAKVVEIDPKRGEVKLSIKALREDSERNAYQQYRAQVKQEAKFGTFADLLAKKTSAPK